MCQLNQSPWDVIPFDSDSIQVPSLSQSLHSIRYFIILVIPRPRLDLYALTHLGFSLFRLRVHHPKFSSLPSSLLSLLTPN